MINFYQDVIAKGPWMNDPNKHNDFNLLEPVMRRKVQAIIADAKSHGVEVCCYETFRSSARQQQLFAQGATQLRVVGVHHYGLAADIVPLDENGNPTWDNTQAFKLIAHLAHAYDLITGSDWGHPWRPTSFPDLPHVQRLAVIDQGSLFRGEFYPGDTYSPYKPNNIA